VHANGRAFLHGASGYRRPTERIWGFLLEPFTRP
jgi:hypothetical protein